MSNDDISGLKLSDNTYNNMKFFVQIVLPALVVLYTTLSGIWHFPYVEQVAGTIGAIAVFLGVILRISSSNYSAVVKKDSGRTPDGSFVVTQDIEGKYKVTLEFEKNPDDLLDNENLIFQVKKTKEVVRE